MSQAYRLLREGMPRGTGGHAPPFVAEAKKVRDWVAALPRANAQATQHELSRVLDSLCAVSLEGSQRFLVLEELRSVIIECIGMLQLQYAGTALPLPPQKAMLAHQAEALHVVLAHAYRKATVEICAPSGNVPMLSFSTNVTQALAYSAWHYSQALAIAWRIYRAPPAGVWQGLHRIYRFATEKKLDSKRVNEKIADAAPLEIRTLYVQTLLMAITNPLTFSRVEQGSLWQATRNIAPRCALLQAALKDNAPVVPEDADVGPGPEISGESPTQWLDIEPFRDEVETALQCERNGLAELTIARDKSVRVPVEMLQRLKRAFGLAASRRCKRLPAGHELRTVIGLNSLHFYLSGQCDFDTFMRQSSQRGARRGNRDFGINTTHNAQTPVFIAKARDQSLGGYQLAWDNADQIRVHVGELVGITLAEADESLDWMVGVVRWVSYQANGGLLAGVELLSRHAVAVGLHVYDADGSIRAPLRSVEIDMLNGGDTRCLLTSNVLGAEPTRVEVIRGAVEFSVDAAPLSEGMLVRADVLMNAGDYVVLRPLREDLVVESADGIIA